MFAKLSYYKIKELLKGKNYPLAIVDLDGLDKNYEFFANEAIQHRKKIRIASKSIRVPYLLKYIYEKNKGLISGIMCYRVKEAEFLFSQGFKDLLIAYPEVSAENLETLALLTKKGCKASIVVDCKEHLDLFDIYGSKHNVVINTILELDGAIRFFEGKVNLGVRRSPVRSIEDVRKLLDYYKTKKNISLHGIMLYEAQVAGLADESPWSKVQNPVKKRIKQMSIPKIEEFRQKTIELIYKEGFKPEIINGGGSGSIYSSVKDKSLTEVTVGSGFICSHLFSYYKDIELVPSVFYAIQVVRKPEPDYITCCGGGYIASGSMGMDRLPEVFMPLGIKPTDIEGFGEVQTPFKITDKKVQIDLGDPVILRHAKAGELAEHFNSYFLFRNSEIIAEEKTYRGLGYNFL